jgi:hypothetical protein
MSQRDIVSIWRDIPMKVKTIAELAVLLGIAVGVGGCLAIAVGAGAAGTVAYLAGDLKAEEPHVIDAVYAAAVKALQELELDVAEDRTTKDALAATIMARDAQDKQIEVKLASTTSDTTEISIRVGVFGNETKSRLIYKQIQKNLENR